MVDALRWVFGEQNPRLLRGQRWQEIIFGGSASRRPLALAEVTALLDNTTGSLDLPYSEVEISRRLLRSGETEYSINRQSCRLKDVYDLLSGTGAAGSYSYIAQSAVDEALNARPEDRRAAFEDAAGLGRYRQRRQDAARRLGEIEHAGQRLADIIAELQRQIEPLAREAGQAERFLVLRREREEVEALLWADAAFHQQRRHADAVGRGEEVTARLAEGRRILASMEQEGASAHRNLSVLRGLHSAAEASARTLLSDENRRRAACAVLHERLTNLKTEDTSLSDRLKRLELRHGEIRLVLDGQPADAAAGHATDRRAASLLDEAKARLATAEARREEQSARRRQHARALEVQAREAATLREALRSRKSRLAALDGRLAAIEQELAKAGAELARHGEAAAKARSALDRLESSLTPLRRRRQEIQQQLDSLRSLHADERDKQSVLNAELLVINERLAALDRKPPVAAAAAAEAVKLARELLGTQPALLGDILVVDSGYERAVEAALGLGLYALVVPDWEAALAIVKGRPVEGSAGTAVFLPACASPAIREAVPPALDALTGHVRYSQPDGRGASLAGALLTGVAVTDALPAAIEAVRNWPSLFSAVTRDGKAVLQGGMVLDGLPLLQAGPVSTRREHDEAAREAQRLTAGRSESAARLKALASRAEALAREGTEAAAGLAEAESERQREAAIAGRSAELLAALNARSQVLAEEQARAARERAELLTAIQDIEDKLASVAGRTASLNAELAAAADEAARADAGYRDAHAAYNQQRVELARAEEAGRADQERRRQLATEAESLAKELASAVTRHEEIVANSSQASGELAAQQEALEACAASRAVQDRESQRLQGLLAAAEETAAGLTRQIREMTAANTALEGRGHRLELLLERLAGEGRNLALAQKSLHPRFASLQPAAHADPETLQGQVTELAAQLAELGQVDLGASEQYRRLRDRQEFLLRQQAELQDSAAALRSGAEEIEREMARRFQDCFERIRGEFRTTFAGLFGGGEADLRLTDPADPLGSGVDIYAQPPGKRMASLALLSGGERALTAIALLFALSGSPVHGFSVLDEVDAYLDEPNCVRFSRYLRSLSADRQFLIITHNKGTMEAADVLYGLTMEEHGVSRVISVRLDQAAATGEATG